MNNYCVYMHKNKKNKKIYIGITNNIKRRWRCDGVEYNPRREYKSSFWGAIQKYGFENFEHIIIERNLSKEEAEEKEKYYIKKFDSTNKRKGYNISEGGNGGKIYENHPKGMLGKHHSEEKKIKQRELMKKLNEEGKCGAVWKNGHPRGMLGKHHSEEYIDRLKNQEPHKNSHAKRTMIIFPNGERKIYECMKYLREEYGIGQSLIIKIIKSKKPYKLSKCISHNRENLKKIDGCIIKYIENTEITE